VVSTLAGTGSGNALVDGVGEGVGVTVPLGLLVGVKVGEGVGLGVTGMGHPVDPSEKVVNMGGQGMQAAAPVVLVKVLMGHRVGVMPFKGQKEPRGQG
jgi:hypothetical protein